MRADEGRDGGLVEVVPEARLEERAVLEQLEEQGEQGEQVEQGEQGQKARRSQ